MGFSDEVAIGAVLIRFMMPAVEEARQHGSDTLIWTAPGPWQKAESTVS